MTKKKKTEPEYRPPDALIVDKASFLAKLIDRIHAGIALANRQITNLDELEANQKDFNKWSDYNSEYLKQSFNNEQNEYKTGYDVVNRYLNIWGTGGNTPQEKLKNLREEIQNKVDYLEKIKDKVDLLKSDVESTVNTEVAMKAEVADGDKIFIVHGHNTEVEQSVARAIEKLGLTPIILHEQPNSGKTIIEKFEANSNVGFAIVLLTDDDEGKSKQEIDLKKRARQNVVLELGYFIGKLGRERVLPLYSEGVELPSDINGLLYVLLDKTETWKFALVKELKAANYAVDANKLL